MSAPVPSVTGATGTFNGTGAGSALTSSTLPPTNLAAIAISARASVASSIPGINGSWTTASSVGFASLFDSSYNSSTSRAAGPTSSVTPKPMPVGSSPVRPGSLTGIVVGVVFGVAAIFSLACWQWWRLCIQNKAAKETANNQIALGPQDLNPSIDLLCAYAVSGQYGYIPRILFYILVGIVVLIRKQVWLAAGASAYIMTYAGAAAVHAIIMCGIHASSNSWLPDGRVWLGDGKSVWVRGLVLDLDTDATLAIVGVGFLMLLPLAVYSTTFQRSEAKPILAAWGVLMLVGAICCLITLYTVDTTSGGSFNQYRICNTNITDSHSIPNTLPPLGSDWNQTIREYFNTQSTASKSCFYPCLYSSQILHSPSDITAVPFPIIQAGSSRYWTFKILAALVYACVPLYIVGGIILLFHKRFWDHSPKDQSAFHAMRDRFVALASSPMTLKVGLEFVFVSFQAYALVFAPFVMVVFVIFAEFSLSLDPESESIQHVGQWQPLVSVVLVGIAAILSKYSEEFDRLGLWQEKEEDPDEPTELFRSMRLGG